MRVACAALIASAAVCLGLAGCTSPGTGSADPVRPAAATGAPAAPTVGARADVCAAIRTAVAARMKPLGTALGQYVGFRAASDAPDQRAAANAVKAELAALSAAISSAGAHADDPALKVVTANTASALDGLADDATLLAVLAEMSDIPATLARLTSAVQPVTDACS